MLNIMVVWQAHKRLLAKKLSKLMLSSPMCRINASEPSKEDVDDDDNDDGDEAEKQEKK